MKKIISISAIVASILNANQIIEIHQGWNLIGINEIAPNMKVSDLVDTNKTDIIVTNINGAWRKYDPQLSFLQQFQYFESKRGYWIKATADYNITIDGMVENSLPQLIAGWNLVAVNEDNVANVIDSYENVGYHVDIIVTNINGAWRKYDPQLSFLQQFQSFDRNKGYWIKVEKLAAVATTRDGYDVKLYVDNENADVSVLANAISNYNLTELSNISNLFSDVSNIVVSGTNNGQVIESSYIDPTDSTFSQALTDAKNQIDNPSITGGTSLYVYGISEGGSPFIISEAKVYKVNDDGTKGEYLGTTSQTGYLYLSDITDGQKVWVEKDGFFYSIQTIRAVSGSANYIFLTQTNIDLTQTDTATSTTDENARLLSKVLYGWDSFIKKDNAGHGYFIPSNIRFKRGNSFIFQPVNSITPLFESENLQDMIFENGYNANVLSILVSGGITPNGVSVNIPFADMLEINTQYSDTSLNSIEAVLGFNLDNFPRLKEKLLDNSGNIDSNKVGDVKRYIKVYKYTSTGWQEINSNDISLIIDNVNSNDDNIKNIYHSNPANNAAIKVTNLSSATLLVATFKEPVNETPSVTYNTYGLNVKVLDENNEPLPNALVKIRRGTGGTEVISYTDGNGTAHFDILAAEGAIENISINAIEGSHYPVSRVISLSSLNEDENTTITLQMEAPPSYATVKGVIKDIDTNESIVNAKVKLIYPIALADVQKDVQKIINNQVVTGLEVGLVPNARYKWYIKAHSDSDNLNTTSVARVSTERWILVQEATAADGGNFLPYEKIVAQALAAPISTDPNDVQIIPTGQFDIAVEVDHDIDADGSYDFVELASVDANQPNLSGEEFSSNVDNNYGRTLGFISTSIDIAKLIKENAGSVTQEDAIYVDLNNSGTFTTYESVNDLGLLEDYTIADSIDGSGNLLSGTTYNIGDNIKIDLSNNERYILISDETHHTEEHEITNTTWKVGISTTLKDTSGQEHYFVLKKVGNEYEWVEKSTSGIDATDDDYLVNVKSGEFAGIEYNDVGRFISQNQIFKKLAEKISDIKNNLNLGYDLQNPENTIVEDGFTVTLVADLDFNITSDTTSIPVGTPFKIRKKATIALGGNDNRIEDYIKLDQVIVDRPVLTESMQTTHTDRVGLYQFSAVPLSYGELNVQESLLRVESEKLGYYNSPVVNVPKFTQDNTATTDVREDVQRVDLSMKLKPTYRVDVNVTDTDGNPINDAIVIIDGVMSENTDLTESESLSAREGSYVTFDNVIGGRGTTRVIRVSVPDSNYIPVIKTLRNLDSNKVVDVQLVSTDQIADFPPTITIIDSSINYNSGVAQISVEIVDKDDGTTTITPENIYVTNNGDVASAVINQNGTTFNISLPLNIGENQIRVEAANTQGISRSNTITLEYNADVGSIAGTIRGITDENGDGLVDSNRLLVLDIFDENGLYINTAMPSVDGRYILQDLEAGKEYKLQALEVDVQNNRIVKKSDLVDVTVPRGQVFSQDITLNELPQTTIEGAPEIDLIGDLTQEPVSSTGELNVSFTVSNFDLDNGARAAVVVNDIPYIVDNSKFNSDGSDNYSYNVQNFTVQLRPGQNIIYVVAQNPDGSFDYSADIPVYWDTVDNNATLATLTINAVDSANNPVPVQIELTDNNHNFINAETSENGNVEFTGILSGEYFVNIYPMLPNYTPVVDYNVSLNVGSNELNITIPEADTTIDVPEFYISNIDLNDTEFAVNTSYSATVRITGADSNYSVDNGYTYTWAYRYIDENGTEVINSLPCNTQECQFSIPVTGWVDLDVNVTKNGHSEIGGTQIYIQNVVVPMPPEVPEFPTVPNM